MNALDENLIDLIIDARLPLKSWHVQQNLYQEELVCVVRGDDELTDLDYWLLFQRSKGIQSISKVSKTRATTKSTKSSMVLG
jgi:hypothetical protein